MTAGMVEFRGVGKTYAGRAGGRVPALADVTFRLEPGELAVLAGPAGAGKSTLLRLAWGEERPSRGTVRVAGVDVAALSGRALRRLRRRLGVVPDDGVLLPEWTVLGNVTLVLRALGVGRGAARARAASALRRVGLGPRLARGPGDLAAGERRRVLLARALAVEPAVLLVDDGPGDLAGPEETGGEGPLAALRQAGAAGTTVLVATRTPDVAARLGGRLLRLEGGRLGDPGGTG
jgi:ABC-type ATPase involved in cell division